MKFTPFFLAELKSRVDLPALIGRYVPELKQVGVDNYTACCPFHDEKTPSFRVSAKKGSYKCWGCGNHGDGIGFLLAMTGKSFPDVVKELASFAGMPLPKEDAPEKSAQEKSDATRYMRACAALEEAHAIYSKCLAVDKPAQAYLSERGVNQESIARFGLGYAPAAWGTVTGHRAVQSCKKSLIDAGLTSKTEKSKREFDRFRDRIMFPIYGSKDRLIGFGGRAITINAKASQKYINSPETILFSKGDHLYGIKLARDAIYKAKRVYVFEGYMDVVMVSQVGVHNVVATLGTSITEMHIRKLFGLCSHVTFCMDGDAPGIAAAWRAAVNVIELVDDKHRVDFMLLPNEMDPDDFVRERGKEGFEQAADEATTLTDYLLDTLISKTNIENGESLAVFLSESNDFAERFTSDIIRLAFQKQVAARAGISLDTMLLMLSANKNRILKTEQPPVRVAEMPAVQVLPIPIQPSNATVEISVAAKLLCLSILKDKKVVESLDPDYLSRFLSSSDQVLLFPLIAYIKANPMGTDEALLATLSYSSHIKLLATLVRASRLIGEGFNATNEAKHIIDGFRKMERVWQIVSGGGSESALAIVS